MFPEDMKDALLVFLFFNPVPEECFYNNMEIIFLYAGINEVAQRFRESDLLCQRSVFDPVSAVYLLLSGLSRWP